MKSINENKDFNGNLVSIRAGTTDSKVVFVDWFNDKCLNMWKAGINQIYQTVPFDGLWLNLNEVTTAVSGESLFKEEKEKLQEKRSKFLLY